jgi:hypothetical protein
MTNPRLLPIVLRTAVLLLLCPEAASFFSGAYDIGHWVVGLRRAPCAREYACASHSRIRMSSSDEAMPSRRNEGDEYRLESFTRGMTPPKNFLLMQNDRWKRFPKIFILLSNPTTNNEGICEFLSTNAYHLIFIYRK